MTKGILTIISVLLFMLSCDRRDYIIRTSHMGMDYQYCNSFEGREAIKKAYNKFLSDSTGETECECECENIKEELEVCETYLDNLKRQLNIKNVQNSDKKVLDWKK